MGGTGGAVNLAGDNNTIGEIWYERSGSADVAPSLLLKLLFTDQPLSIQVHPDDAYAQSIGLSNGKTEAWYVLSATPDARIAVGLKQELAAPQLRTAIEVGSISDLIQWRGAVKGDITIKGEEALWFVRERKQLPRGDFDRAENQRNVIKAIVQKGLSPAVISNPVTFLKFISG